MRGGVGGVGGGVFAGGSVGVVHTRPSTRARVPINYSIPTISD